MNKMLSTKLFVFLGLFSAFTLLNIAKAQTVVNTNHISNNGSGMVTFHVQNTNTYAIIITEVRSMTSVAGGTTTVLYNPVAYTGTTWTAGTVGAGQNGWVLAGNGVAAVANIETPFLTGPNLVTIPPGETYGFAVSVASLRYMTLTTGAGVNTFSGGGVNILTGDGIGWSSTVVPVTPNIHPRGFIGGITWIPGTPPAPNDAGITGFVNPVIPTCTFNDSVAVTLKNFGSDTLTSAIINWSKNGTNLAPAFWTGSLPPLATQTVFVGTTVYVSGDDLCAWTSNPNGTVEPVANSVNDSSCINGLSTGLSGTYTIGGITPDFNDFTSAIAALNFAGICGPVVFNIRPGTYTDQFDLTGIVGMDATKTVTFRSETGNRADVIVEFPGTSAANNYIVKLTGADYFRFESMTLRNTGASFGNVVAISGGSDYNTFTDCYLHSVANSTTSTNIAVIYEPTGSLDEFNKFIGNSIVGGSYGAYNYGSSTTALQEGTEFIDNEFIDNYYMGLRFYYAKNVKAINNRFYGQSTYATRYGIYAYYTDGASVFTHNSIEANPSSTFYYGMYFSNCDATANNRGLIANNSVSTGSIGSTGTSYTFYYITCGYFNIYNNSFDVIGGGTGSRALYISGGGGNNVKNNSITNFGAGHSAYIIGTYSINEMDYNNLYSTGTNLAYFDAANTATFADWKNASGYDDNGVNVNPGYYSAYDLHVCSDSLNGKGTPLAIVTNDRDMQPRDASNPDIGSDEFSPLGQPGFLGPDALVCTGQTVTIYAGAPSDIVAWSTGDSTNALVLTNPGTYTVTVTGACGTAFDTITVTTSALNYTGYLVADTTAFCTGGSALLTCTMPASTYIWTGGSTNDSLVVTTGGTYTLNITDACGSGNQSIVITENTVPVASFTTSTSFVTGIFNNTSTGGGNQTYLWNFGDNTTSTQMNPTHIYNAVGTFTVTLTVTNECGTNTTTSTITVSNLGIEEVEGVGSIAVYPNPSNGIFQLDFNTNNEMIITVQVTNVLGETVFVKNVGSVNGIHKDAIDISKASPGVYYVNILSNNEKVMTNKLVNQ
jgi:PKD repeat protein